MLFFYLIFTEKTRNYFDNIINIKAMTIKIYDQETNNYLDSLHYLNDKLNKKEIEEIIKEYYNLNKIYYSIS